MKLKSHACKAMVLVAMLVAVSSECLHAEKTATSGTSIQSSGKFPLQSFQPLNKPHRINLPANDGQVYNQAVGVNFNPQPGDTLVIPTKITSFNIAHFSGAPGNPIVIVPEDSAYIGAYAPYVGNISYARYFKITGFHLDGSRLPSNGLTPSNFGMLIGPQADHFEACNFNIRNCGIGFCTKQNPDPSSSSGYYPNYTQDSVCLHHIYVRNTRTEGFYIGYTNDVIRPLASPINHLVIHDITADSTGWDGIQLSDCLNVLLHDVNVNHFGLLNEGGQQNGMLFGGQVTLQDSAYNINVSNGTGAGLLIFGRQLFKVTDVVLTNTATSYGQSAIYISDFNDIGYGTGPLQIDFRRFSVSGASLYALDNANNNGTTLPGSVRDIEYSKTGAGINDKIDTIKKVTASFNFFPNPVLDQLHISSIKGKNGNVDITIFNLNGKLYSTSNFVKQKISDATSINVSSLRPGIYLLQLKFEDGSGVSRQFLKI